MASVQILAGDLSRVFTYTGKTIAGVNGAPTPGVIFEDGLTGKRFKYVLNGHSAAQAVGNIGCVDYNGAGLTLAMGPVAAIAGQTVVVFKPSTATLNLMAGVWMGAAALSNTTQTGAGWIQYKGQNDSCLVDSTTDVVIGDSLKAVNATFAAVKDAASGTRVSFENYLVALIAATANAEGLISCYISCTANA